MTPFTMMRSSLSSSLAGTLAEAVARLLSPWGFLRHASKPEHVELIFSLKHTHHFTHIVLAIVMDMLANFEILSGFFARILGENVVLSGLQNGE
jgi:hypothetical protein